MASVNNSSSSAASVSFSRSISDNVEKLSIKISTITKDIFSKIASFFRAFIGYFYIRPKQTESPSSDDSVAIEEVEEEVESSSSNNSAEVEAEEEETSPSSNDSVAIEEEEEAEKKPPNTDPLDMGYSKWTKIALCTAGIGTVLALGALGYYYFSATSAAEAAINSLTSGNLSNGCPQIFNSSTTPIIDGKVQKVIGNCLGDSFTQAKSSSSVVWDALNQSVKVFNETGNKLFYEVLSNVSKPIQTTISEQSSGLLKTLTNAFGAFKAAGDSIEPAF